MKKLGIMLICCFLIASMACAKTPAGVAESAVFVDPNAVKAHAYGNLFFTAEGFRFGIYDPVQDLLDRMEPNTTFAETSCAFEGNDNYYFFNGFEVMANDIDGAERITAVTINDDTVKTPDGLYIGMPETELENLTGMQPDAGGLLIQTDGTAQRNITVQDGIVRAIAYVPAE